VQIQVSNRGSTSVQLFGASPTVDPCFRPWIERQYTFLVRCGRRCVGFRIVSGIRRILTKAPIVAGASGSPVLNGDGKVIALAATGTAVFESSQTTEHQSVVHSDAIRFLKTTSQAQTWAISVMPARAKHRETSKPKGKRLSRWRH
jgi:hypothetical protein